MNKKIGAGIIGTLHAHAVGHLKALRVSEVFELIAVAEPNEELLARAKKDPRWTDVRWITIVALLSDENVRPGTTILSLAFGPGLSVCGGLFRKH